jgi:hypothetical protein
MTFDWTEISGNSCMDTVRELEKIGIRQVGSIGEKAAAD